MNSNATGSLSLGGGTGNGGVTPVPTMVSSSDPASGRVVLIPEGVYPARLADVRPFTGAFGPRVGLTFELTEGDQAGVTLMESAALTVNGKLAALVAGVGELRGSPEAELRRLIGRRCLVEVRHGSTKAGTPYASIVRTMP